MESVPATPAAAEQASGRHRRHLAVVQSDPPPSQVEGLIERRFPDLDALVLTKTTAGFDVQQIERFREIVRSAASGQIEPIKFLVIDFAHAGEAAADGCQAFDALVSEAANLILQAPIVLVANARGPMAGADLEFALACSMLIGEADAAFSFEADPIVSIGTYVFLAQKIGFVRAERLMEAGESLLAQQMHDLLLLKDVGEPGSGLESIVGFLRRTARRHNSCCGIYRAHRMTTQGGRDSLRSYG
jgi:enoyl-CoA hydratase/carnithine racemase